MKCNGGFDLTVIAVVLFKLPVVYSKADLSLLSCDQSRFKFNQPATISAVKNKKKSQRESSPLECLSVLSLLFLTLSKIKILNRLRENLTCTLHARYMLACTHRQKDAQQAIAALLLLVVTLE